MHCFYLIFRFWFLARQIKLILGPVYVSMQWKPHNWFSDYCFSSDYNPLSGNGGGFSYRPPRRGTYVNESLCYIFIQISDGEWGIWKCNMENKPQLIKELLQQVGSLKVAWSWQNSLPNLFCWPATQLFTSIIFVLWCTAKKPLTRRVTMCDQIQLVGTQSFRKVLTQMW